MKFDVVFLSYDEPACEQNWQRLKDKVPSARRVHGVHGIWQAHQACAQVASTDSFFLVDGDAEIREDFEFAAPESDEARLRNSVFLWRSVNPVNDLINGHGAVKLVPRGAFLSGVVGLDMTTCLDQRFRRVDIVASVSRFNTSELSAWRGGFRECAKLAAGVLDKGTEWERRQRLQLWCSRGHDRPFGEWCVRGAMAGREFGLANRGQPEALELINDYRALELMFREGPAACGATGHAATAS